MPKGMQAIYTRTVGAGGIGGIELNNIPQTYSDIKISISARSTRTGFTEQNFFILPNIDTDNNGSWTRATGNGSTGASARAANTAFVPIGLIPAANASSSTFGTMEVYMPNYSNASFKQYTVEGLGENNATGANQFLVAAMYRSNAPITRLYFTDEAGTIAEGSTITLYGIAK